MRFIKTLVTTALLLGVLAGVADARILRVDRRGGGDFTSLRAAGDEAGPGDTIEIAKGSGPYREMLHVKRSGTPETPIVIEGNGELITGFEPLAGFRQEDGRWVCDLPRKYPAVIAYRGERLVVSSKTGQPLRHATLDPERTRLVLLPGVRPEGWEISSRGFVVRIHEASHQLYRNIRTSGGLNDGFNLHGDGQGLVFENIEAFHNLDEGFSAHDTIRCRIKGGLFWGNDNGIANIGASEMQAENVAVFANLGFGLLLSKCSAEIEGLRAWDNGVTQIYIASGSRVTFERTTAYEPRWDTRPWESHMESKASTLSAPVRINPSDITGAPVVKPSRDIPANPVESGIPL